MDPNQFDHRYSREDAFELVGAQALRLVIAVFAGIVAGAAYADATLLTGQRINFPYKSVAAAALLAFAVWNAVSIPPASPSSGTRPPPGGASCRALCRSRWWGLVAAIAGLALAGFRLDLLTREQNMLAWRRTGCWQAGCCTWRRRSARLCFSGVASTCPTLTSRSRAISKPPVQDAFSALLASSSVRGRFLGRD